MPIAIVAAVVGVAAGIGGAVMQAKAAKQQKKAMQRSQDAQLEQNRIEQARANVQAQRERVQQVREARIRRASVISSAGNAGVGVGTGTSGLSGATSSIQSQLGQNLGTLGQMQSFGEQLSVANQKEAQAQSDYITAGAQGQMWQSIFGAVGQVANTASSFGGGLKGAGTKAGGGNTFKSIFG